MARRRVTTSTCYNSRTADFLTVKLTRDRKFRGSTTYTQDGKALKAIIFILNDLYDIENKEEEQNEI